MVCVSRKKENEGVKAQSLPLPTPPERPHRPPLPPRMPYPIAPLLEEDVKRILGDILKRLDSIEMRLDRIEKLLTSRK